MLFTYKNTLSEMTGEIGTICSLHGLRWSVWSDTDTLKSPTRVLLKFDKFFTLKCPSPIPLSSCQVLDASISGQVKSLCYIEY